MSQYYPMIKIFRKQISIRRLAGLWGESGHLHPNYSDLLRVAFTYKFKRGKFLT